MIEVTEALLDQWLRRGCPAVFGAGSGTGKTHLTVQIMKAAGDKLGKVLYLATDRASIEYQLLFAKAGLKLDHFYTTADDVCDRLKRSYNSLLTQIDEIEDYKKTFLWGDELVRRIKPDTLIVDVGANFIPCSNINHPQKAGAACNFVVGWAMYHNLRMLLLWHINKTAKQNLKDPFDAMSGAHAVQGMNSSKFLLERPGIDDDEKNDSPYFQLLCRPTLGPEQKIFLSKQDDGFFRVEHAHDRAARDYPILKLIPEYPDEVKRADLLETVQNGSGPSSRTIDQALAELVEAGLVLRPHRGCYSKVSVIV